jgi:insertion element IS1 protein InsB
MKKKDSDIAQVTHAVLKTLHPAHVEGEICRAEELAQRRGLTSARDERWSDGGKKAAPRWVWHAIDPHRGTVLASVFGRRKDAGFLQRQTLLEPCGSTRFSTDGWGAYERHIDPEQHHGGKEHTQKIESQHLNLRTRIKRLVRRTMGFAKTTTMHDLVIGLFINRDEFGGAIEHEINTFATPSKGLFCSKIDQKTHIRNQNQVPGPATGFLAGETVGFCLNAYAGPMWSERRQSAYVDRGHLSPRRFL